jgi:hypothetical protein
MNSNYAPICLFTYNRLKETTQTVKALKQNFIASKSKLIIFSDGPKNRDAKVNEVRKFLNTIDGFLDIEYHFSEENRGLANSIINGVSTVLEKYEKVIVLEDDLITSANFLNFMNDALDYYSPNTVFSISGYTLKLPVLNNKLKDVYFGLRASSWGWGIWKSNWSNIDWEVTNYSNFINDRVLRKDFNKGGSDMTHMLRRQINGDIDSWAIRFCFQQFLDKKPTVFPTTSKIQNIGFSKDATHTSGVTKFITELDYLKKVDFDFIPFEKYDSTILKQFRRVYSIRQRIFDRLIKLMIND